MGAIERLIQTAKNEIGYLEKKSNSQLDDKTANAGSANYTKYGRDMHNIYPSVMDFPAAWCDCFVDWCFYKTFGISTAKSLLAGNFDDYTVASSNMYKNKGAWYTSPQIGDQIFFKNSTRICHTGIVYDVKDNIVYTIEGNTSSGKEVIANGGAVCAKQYNINNSKIAGYGRPLYSLAEQNEVNTMRYGIDVSDNQGVIDWKKVKADGIEFAIIRSTRKSGNADKYLEQNIKGCIDNGIPFDFYKYSYALTNKDVQNEAKAVVEAIKAAGVTPSKDITIWFDCEDDSQIALGKPALYDLYDCFKEVVWNSGFSYGLYMGKYDYENYSDFTDLDDKVWIARYPDTTTRTLKNVPSATYKPVPRGKNVLWGWQFSSKGNINGISGNVDLNVSYTESTAIVPVVEPKVEYYPIPQFTLNESLARINVDVSKSNRAKIAAINGIDNYTGTVEQNIKMLDLLMQGKLIR